MESEEPVKRFCILPLLGVLLASTAIAQPPPNLPPRPGMELVQISGISTGYGTTQVLANFAAGDQAELDASAVLVEKMLNGEMHPLDNSGWWITEIYTIHNPPPPLLPFGAAATWTVWYVTESEHRPDT